MTNYVTTALIWSAMGLIAGFIAGVGVKVRWIDNFFSKEDRDRIFGLVLIFIGLTAIAQNLYFQSHQREITNCQTEYNSAFQITLQERSKIGDEDRQNLFKMITTVTSAKSRAVSRQALENYINTNLRLDQERKTFKYPAIPKENCR